MKEGSGLDGGSGSRWFVKYINFNNLQYMG